MMLKHWIKEVKEKWVLKKKERKFKKAKKLANQLTAVYNRRFYVFLQNGEYTVLSKNQLDSMKKQGYVSKRATAFDYAKQCVYYTK